MCKKITTNLTRWKSAGKPCKHQGNDGTIQSANLSIPGAGNNKIRNGSTIAIEIEGGVVTLIVFGDINSITPTHEIDISGALESNRVKIDAKDALDAVRYANNLTAEHQKSVVGQLIDFAQRIPQDASVETKDDRSKSFMSLLAKK